MKRLIILMAIALAAFLAIPIDSHAQGTGVGTSYTTYKERSTAPATPSSTYDRIYFKSDGLYYINSAGVSSRVSDGTKQIFTSATKLTIASGVITPTQAVHTVETAASAATDDLDTITAGSDAQLLLIRAFHADRTVVVKSNTGNIYTGGSDITLDDTSKYLLFIYDSALTKWVVIGGGGGSSAVSGKVCKTVTNPSASDTHLLFDVGAARTITKVSCICYGGTSAQATLYNAGSDGSGSTAIHSAVTCDTNGANTSTISSATVTDGDIIYMAVGTVTGVVTQVMVCYE